MSRIEPTHSYAASATASDAPVAKTRAKPVLSTIARQVAQQYRRDTMSPVIVSGVLRLLEFGLLLISGALFYALHVGVTTHLFWHYPVIIFGVSLLTVILLEVADCYQMSALRKPLAMAPRILLIWAGTLSVFVLLGFFLKISEEFSRLWAGGWMACGFAVLMMLRLVTSRLIRRWARNGTMERRAVIVGGGKNAETLIRSIERQPSNDIRICGIFDDRDDRRSPPIVAGYPKLGNVAELVEFARIARVDMLIVTLPLTAEQRVLSMLKKLWVLPVDIRLSAHANQMHFRPRAYSYIGSVPMLDIFDKPINDWDSVAKRA